MLRGRAGAVMALRALCWLKLCVLGGKAAVPSSASPNSNTLEGERENDAFPRLFISYIITALPYNATTRLPAGGGHEAQPAAQTHGSMIKLVILAAADLARGALR